MVEVILHSIDISCCLFNFLSIEDFINAILNGRIFYYL